VNVKVKSLRWKLPATCWVATIGIAAVYGYVSATANPTPLLTATLISPALGKDGSIEAEPFRHITVRWEVKNVGNAAVSGVTVGGANCQCRILDPFPATLSRGQSATATATIRAPPAGRAERTLAISSDGSARPLLTMSVPIHVRLQTPAWIMAPRGAAFRFVARQASSQDAVWDAIERTAVAPWLESVKIEPAGTLAVHLDCDQRPYGEDGAYCLRTYRLSVSAEGNPIGVFNGTAVFQTTSATPAPPPIPVEVEVLPAISVIPAKISLTAGGADPSRSAAKVTVIRRVEAAPPVALKFDESVIGVTMLEVESGSAPAFEIRSQAGAFGKTETEVTFAVDGFEPVRLPVEIVTE
jgi:hypothetical protein